MDKISEIRERVKLAEDDLEFSGRSGYYPFDDMNYLLTEIERLQKLNAAMQCCYNCKHSNRNHYAQLKPVCDKCLRENQWQWEGETP